MINPRKTVLTVSALALFICMSIIAPVTAAQPATPKVVLLFTGDIHGHLEGWIGWDGELAGKNIGGFDRLAGAVRIVKEEVGVGNVLLLDAGDAVGDTMIAAETKGRAIIQAMNAVGYDAMAIGNHEPDFAVAGLEQLMEQSKFPMLAANLRRASGELFAKPYLVREIAGIKIGILGLAYPNTPLTTAKKNVEGLTFQDPIECAREWVPKLRSEGADVIVALTHLGLGADIKLANGIPGIDVILGGHSHNRTTQPIREGSTIIMHAGAHCSDLGRLDLSFNSNGKLREATGRLILLEHEKISADKDLARVVAALTSPHKESLSKIIATASKPITRAQTIAGNSPQKRDEQSPADSLLADIIREVTGSEVALLPGVGYGVAIPEGPITQEALRNLIPHDSKVVTLTLTGEQIIEILEQSLKNTHAQDPSTKVGGMIQVSGLEFRYDPQALQVVQCAVGGIKIEPLKQYAVATNSMLAEGGHNYRTFLHGENPREHETQFAIIKQWMVRQKTVKTPLSSRIFKGPETERRP
jgi:2',3'-cyclic-nucleotide 2'-phosphodiesterase (5'-nucleotidase family)